MPGNKILFPVICLVGIHAALAFGPPRTSPRSWGIPNEIFGSTMEPPRFRPTPGLLIAGHGPMPLVAGRPLGPLRHPGRPFLPLVTSTPIPTPSAWPSHGPQIQRAQESTHFEFLEKVAPRLSRPSRLGPRMPPRPIPSDLPPTLVPVLARDAIITMSPRPQKRTSSPPPFMMSGPPLGPPTFATPSEADFQEGYRILHDLFGDHGNADIRSNLVGGSDVSFSDALRPIPSPSLGRNNTAPKENDNIQITPAKEQGVLIADSQPQGKPTTEQPEGDGKPGDQKTSSTDIAYGPPRFRHGPPQNHVSYMFSDPNEAPGRYNLYESGYETGPPPPFHTIGNTILPPNPPPRPPQEARGPPPTPQSTNQPEAAPSQNPGGYSGPPPNQGGYSGPPPNQGGYSGPPPDNVLRAGPNGPVPMPMMMMPLNAPKGNEPVPSSEEVQRALGVLARFATKQAQSMGMTTSPQMVMQMLQQGAPIPQYGPPNQQYGPPKDQSTPGTTPLQPPQSTPLSNFLSLQVTAPPEPSTQGAPFTTTEPADAITISASPQESSPFPAYGPPAQGNNGGYSSSSSGGSSGGYSSSQVQYINGGGWGSSGGSSGGGGGGGLVDLIGAKVNALRTVGSAVTGGVQQVGALKAGILNAGLNVIGGLSHAKGNIAQSLKIPIMPNKQPDSGYGWPASSTTSSTTAPAPQYGPPSGGWGQGGGSGGGSGGGPIQAIVGAARGVVSGIAGTAAAGAKAAVGIGVSKNEFVKNHFVIKGQAFTDTVSKKIANKNEYFQNVLKHVQSIFNAATTKAPPSGGWSR